MSQNTIEYAAYIRASSDKQTDEHQRDDLEEWCNERSIDYHADVQKYVDFAQSGAKTDREDFLHLLNDIESGIVESVILWEISRVARRPSLAQRFFDAAEDNEVTIWIVNGAVDHIGSDGTNRLIADIFASIYAEERRRLISRTKSGIRHARKQGKWHGPLPKGFTTNEDGYLEPIQMPDYEGGEVGYHDIADAMDRLDDGESYREVARSVPNVTRQTLSNIHKGDRKAWYTGDAEISDDRVAEALCE